MTAKLCFVRFVGLFLGCVLLVSCGQTPGPSGTSDDDGDAAGAGDIPAFDVGADLDGEAVQDTVDTGETTPDGSIDSGDTTDGDATSSGGLGEPCTADVDCTTLECVALGSDETVGICATLCSTDDQCPDGFNCVLITSSGIDAERVCLAVDYCADGDGDQFGIGPGCQGVDCDDEDDAINLGADEVCDGIDNDCDEDIDENTADASADCTTGFQGVCAQGREQCIDGDVQCVAFSSPSDEVCDGLDNDCDGSSDEDVLLEGYQVVDGVCEPISCGDAPEAPANSALLSVSSTQFGGVVIYRCVDGFAALGSPGDVTQVTRVCGATGDWEPVSGVCSAIECGAAPAAGANARLLSVDRTTFNGTAAYACNEGYGVAPGMASRYEVTCGATGAWSSAPTCDPVSCGGLTNPANGVVLTPTGVEYTDVATYSCDSGYVLSSGTSSRICDVTGAWTGSPAICTPVTCGTLSNPPNGSVSLPDGAAFGATARYRCDAGYALAGPETRTCQAVGTWSGVATLCEPISCGALSAPANGTVVTPTGQEFTDVATYSCNSGYVLSGGTSSRVCDSTGSWTGAEAVCTPVDCGPLANPTNGSVVAGDGTSLGATASYSCAAGFALSGSASRTCGITGFWSGSAPTCASTSCGAIAVIPNATASVPSATLGSTATFTCDLGFSPRAGTVATQTCDGTAWTWSGSPLACDPVSCGLLASPENGAVLTPGGVEYADVATYSCISGFTLTGAATRTCGASGTWSGLAPSCSPVDCGAPPNSANASGTFTTTTFGSSASYSCAEGFTRAGPATSTCTAAGTWSAAPTCVEVSCGPLASPANGSVATPSGQEYTDAATYSCSSGYTLSGSVSRTCQATGIWSGSAPTCLAVDCGAPPTVLNGSRAFAGTTYTNSATYSCSAGFSVVGAATLTCNESGSWGTPPTCAADVVCGGLSNPANGNVVTPSGVELNDVATYTCTSGYILTGNATRTCLASGAWSGSAPLCVPVDCGVPPSISNGNRSFTSTAFASTAEYTCIEGYTRSGSSTATCTAAGTWTTPPTCVEVACGALSNPGNGVVATPTGVAFNDVATYSCNAGFILVGTANRTCQATGLWSGSAPICAPLDCGAPPTIANGSRTFTTTTFTSAALYTCTVGFSRTGPAAATCTDAGTWSAPPRCDEVVCGALSAPANGSVNTPTGVEYNDVATYACDVDYLLTGPATRTCEASGAWSGSAPSCTPADCGAPPVVTNGSRSFTGTSIGSSAAYTCNAGFLRTGLASLTCTAELGWGTPPTCTDINECEPPGAVCTATGNVCTNTSGSWQCSCALGFAGGSVSGGNATCVASGESGNLGATCTSDAQCPTGSWCPTDTSQRRCAPRPTLPGGVLMPFQYVPAGTFNMGSAVAELGRGLNETQVSTTVSRNFFASRTEVTQGQWKAVTGGVNPSCLQSPSGTLCSTTNANDNGPVEQIDWYSAVAFANALSVSQGLTACYQLTSCTDPVNGWHDGIHSGCTSARFVGYDCSGYRLPLEGEWERAARAGTTTATYAGNLSVTGCSDTVIAPLAWFCGNSSNRTQAVGTRTLNPWGLADVLGNVYEWTSTWYSETLNGGLDPLEGQSGPSRVVRGGCWNCQARESRAASRAFNAPTVRDVTVGFRLVRSQLPLGALCTADSQCVTNAWCPTNTTERRCSPNPQLGVGVNVPFQYVPAGTFVLGSPSDELGRDSNEGQVSVTLARNYFVSRTEITQAQWRQLSGGVNPACLQSTTGTACSVSNANDNGPVEQVDWYSALAFANALSTSQGLTACYTLTGCSNPTVGWQDGEHSGCTGATFVGYGCTGYRLLNEAEWERAARGNTTTSTYEGNLVTTGCGDTVLPAQSWFCGNADGRTQVVGSRAPNQWGLYDMLGNVAEWTNDRYSATLAAGLDPLGPASGTSRVLRGGSWTSAAQRARVSSRTEDLPTGRDVTFGLRLARSHTVQPNTRGLACTSDAECGFGEWCPTNTTQRRCAPRTAIAPDAVMEFQFVPAGSFIMGSFTTELGRDSDETPVSVTLSRDYFVSRTEVTQQQWTALSNGVNPSCFQADGSSVCSADNGNGSAPVERIDWYSALGYVNALSASRGLPTCYTLSGCSDPTNGWRDGVHTGCTAATFVGPACTGYRLLSEGEWERAARAGAGTETATHAGNLTATNCEDTTLPAIAWFCGNSADRTRVVAQRTPNNYGLYDMLGNVSEWTGDRYATTAIGGPDPLGAPAGSSVVVRGGYWGSTASGVRSAERLSITPGTRGNDSGFRIALTVSDLQSLCLDTSQCVTGGCIGNVCENAVPCVGDSGCPSGQWCPTNTTQRFCSPRLFAGAAHQMDFALIPSGTYQQGTTGDTSSERPFMATITRPYFVSRFEVTQGQWKVATSGVNPSFFQNTTCTSSTCTSTENANDSGPVERLDWYSALAYANWLSSNQGLSRCYTLTPSTCADTVSDWADGDTSCTSAAFTGLTCTGYRLLTESEWEGAARGGTTASNYWGEATDASTVGQYAIYSGNAGSRTRSVGGRLPNPYGLFDMSGNVNEWVWDWNTFSYPSVTATDYLGPSSGSFRAYRGGAWNSSVTSLRSAERGATTPTNFETSLGFRLARTLP